VYTLVNTSHDPINIIRSLSHLPHCFVQQFVLEKRLTAGFLLSQANTARIES